MKTKMALKPKRCAVTGCTNDANLIVMLEDTYNLGEPDEFQFCEADESVPFMCYECAEKNEAGATGISRYRCYPFSKWGDAHRTTGWTTYRDIKTKEKVLI